MLSYQRRQVLEDFGLGHGQAVIVRAPGERWVTELDEVILPAADLTDVKAALGLGKNKEAA
jgi:hypothetical protein